MIKIESEMLKISVVHFCSPRFESNFASPLSKMVNPLLSSFITRPTPISAVRTSVKIEEEDKYFYKASSTTVQYILTCLEKSVLCSLVVVESLVNLDH